MSIKDAWPEKNDQSANATSNMAGVEEKDGEFKVTRVTAAEAKRLKWFATSQDSTFDRGLSLRRVRGFPDRPKPAE